MNYLTISHILITFTLVPYHSSKIHTHYPLTSKLFVLFFFFKWLTHSPSPVYAFHILTGLEPCTGSWSTYQGPHSQRKLTPLSHPTPTHQISIAPPEWRCVCPSPTHASLLTGQCDLEQILHRQPWQLWFHECSSLDFAPVLTDLWLLQSLPPPLAQCSLSLGGGCCVDVLSVAKHSTDSYFLHFDQLWIYVLTTVNFTDLWIERWEFGGPLYTMSV